MPLTPTGMDRPTLCELSPARAPDLMASTVTVSRTQQGRDDKGAVLLLSGLLQRSPEVHWNLCPSSVHVLTPVGLSITWTRKAPRRSRSRWPDPVAAGPWPDGLPSTMLYAR
jgi:hypothetical protein